MNLFAMKIVNMVQVLVEKSRLPTLAKAFVEADIDGTFVLAYVLFLTRYNSVNPWPGFG